MRLPLAAFICLLCVMPLQAADELTPVAQGQWSDWQDGLRARLLFFKGRATLFPDLRESFVFVEIEHEMATSPKIIRFHFDPGQFSCSLVDKDGKAVAQEPLKSGELDNFAARRPARTMVTLPDAASVRLRVSPYCACRNSNEGLFIPFQDKAWLIKAGDKAEYFLTATLTLAPPKDTEDDRTDTWRGTIKLPKLKLRWEAPKKE